MNKHIICAAVVIVFGLSACNDNSSPTGAQQDLLKTPSASPDLGKSKYGQALIGDIGVTPVPIAYDPISPIDPVLSDTAQPGYNHITEGENISKYRPKFWVHIKDDHNRSKYKPEDYEHIQTGDDQSKYKPADWVHYNGPRTIDKTKYIPAGSQHNASGPNETRYNGNNSLN